MSAVLSGITRATNDECAEDSALYSRKRVLLKKAAPEFFLRSRFEDCTKIIVALAEVFPFRAFSFHPLAGLGRAHLQQALQLSPGRRVD